MKSKSLLLRLVVVGAAIILLHGCVSQSKVRYLQETSKTPKVEFENRKSITYRLQTGDQLYIKIYSVDPKTSKFFQTDFPSLMNPTYLYLNSYTVDEFGYINFSFVDKMFVKGLTIVECKDMIQKTLNEYFKDATVQVKLVNFQISILGEVANPGTYTIDRENVNLLQAIGLAGGTTDFGKLDQVKIVRQTPTGSQIMKVDLNHDNVLESDQFYLMPNDIVYIEPRTVKPFILKELPYATILTAITTCIVVISFVNNDL